MFGTSGIRGPVGKDITASLALSVAHALAFDTDRVVIGRDPRESGTILQDTFTAGLRESGVDVIDVGMAATPTIARAVAWQDADAGVTITASHNPAPDNGIKLWQPSGQAFDEPRREAIERRVRNEESELVTAGELGTVESGDHTQDHIDALVNAVDISGELSVIVDTGNGAGGITVQALEALGCRVQTLNAQPDGRFPGRPSEPTADNCQSLATLVANSPAALGIAHDGDADRMRAVDEHGEFLSGDVLLAILASETANAGDRVALPVDTSLAVEDHLAAQDIDTTRTPVGDVYVAQAATDPDVVFGGEPSGAWIWPAQTLCPDGPLAACILASLVADRSLAERASDVETYPLRRQSIEVADKYTLMEKVREDVESQYATVSTLDGVRVDLDDGWFLIRASGTQPLIRVTAEARDSTRATAILDEASALLD